MNLPLSTIGHHKGGKWEQKGVDQRVVAITALQKQSKLIGSVPQSPHIPKD